MIAKDLGISNTILYRWGKEMRANGEQAFPGKGHQTEMEEEVRRLRRENDLLRQERDILKKAATIFLHNPSEVFVHGSAPGGVSGEGHVPYSGCGRERLLRLVATATEHTPVH